MFMQMIAKTHRYVIMLWSRLLSKRTLIRASFFSFTLFFFYKESSLLFYFYYLLIYLFWGKGGSMFHGPWITYLRYQSLWNPIIKDQRTRTHCMPRNSSEKLMGFQAEQSLWIIKTRVNWVVNFLGSTQESEGNEKENRPGSGDASRSLS